MIRALPLLLLLLVGCEASSAAPARAPEKPSYPVASMRWLPPLDDHVYAYKTEDLVARTSGLLTVRVRRMSDTEIELVKPQGAEQLRYQANGIYRVRSGTLLLRTPPEPGARWPAGPNASSRVERVGVKISVEAGTFSDCVEVVEERSLVFEGNPVRATIATTFCPDVGIVRIEARSDEPPTHERVDLRSFARAIDLSKQTP